MSLNNQHRRHIAALFCITFYTLMMFKWLAGQWLYQLDPIIYHTRSDLFTWLLMETGLHQWLTAKSARLLFFDLVFYSIPLVYWFVLQRSDKLVQVVAIIMLLVNWIYIQCYTLYPTSSIESYIAWLLFPFLFIMINLRSFYFILHSLRYFFLFLFASAGLWKFVQQGIFNPQQMSGVLLLQHKEFLASSEGNWFSTLAYWLINHQSVSFMLYLSATILELLFIVGFFTKKFDQLLISAFVVFVIMDLLIMRIYYWELCPFIITLIYSKYKLPSSNKDHNAAY